MGDRCENVDDPRLARALEEYLARDESQGNGGRAKLLSKYADIAEELTACLDAVQVIQQLSPHLIDPLADMSDSLEQIPQFDDYRVLREIGRGGMGVVYEAEQISLGRRVALKVLPLVARMDERRLMRFKNEAHAAALLQHPHIVGVYAVACCDGVHFYAMQLVDGVSLSEVIGRLREKRIAKEISAGGSTVLGEVTALHDKDLERYFRLVAQLGVAAAGALEHAHQTGVIHRDIKPSNLLIDPLQRLWMTDFGLAQLDADQTLTLSGDRLGTLPYMSPEQSLGKTSIMDHRTDIYSLGATLYELTTLRKAFASEQSEALRRQIETLEPVLPRRINEAIPTDLQTIILKAMSKEPADRYQSARQLAEDLERWLAHEPIRARPPTVVNRLQKWGQRHRSLVAVITAAGMLLMTVVAVGSSYFAVRINRVAEEAQAARATAERSLSSFQIARGVQLMNEGRLHDSLAWLTEPLKRGNLTAQDESIQRLRLASVVNRCPRVIRTWTNAESDLTPPGVDCAAINRDGTLLGTGHADGRARMRNTSTGELVAQYSHGGPMRHVAFCPVSDRVVTASDDGTARVWSTRTGEPLGTGARLDDPVIYAEFNSSGTQLLTVTAAGVTQVWDELLQEQVCPPMIHEGFSYGSFGPSNNRASFSPDGTHVLTSYVGHTARVWDATTGRPVTPYLLHDVHVVDAKFSLDGSQVIVLANDRSVFVWDAATGQRLEHHTLSVRHGATSAIGKISPDRSHFVTTNEDGSAQVLEIDADATLAHIGGRSAFLWDVEFSADGRQMVTVHYDGHVTLIDLVAAQAERKTWRFDEPVSWGTCRSDGSVIVLTMTDREARLWNLEDNINPVATLTHGPSETRATHRSRLTSSSAGRDGELVVTSGADGTARVWQVGINRQLCSFKLDFPVALAAISADGQQLVTASQLPNNAILLVVWDTGSGQRLFETEILVEVNQLRFAPDGGGVYICCSDYASGFLRWEFESHAAPMQIDHVGAGQCLAFRSDGKQFATGGRDRTARVWDTETLEMLVPPLRHEASVDGVAFSPNGKMLATCSGDGLIHLWEIDTGFNVSPPIDHGQYVHRIWFSPDGQFLFSADLQGVVRRWDLRVDDWPAAELVHAAEFLGGHRLTSSGSLELIFDETRQHEDQMNLQSFRSELSAEEIVMWHERIADECMSDQQWHAAAWHFERLLQLQKNNIHAHRLQAKAYEQTRQWTKAAAGYAWAIELGVDDVELSLARQRCARLAESEVLVAPGSVWRWLHPTDGSNPAEIITDFHRTFGRLDFDAANWQRERDRVGPRGGFGYGNRVGVEIGKPDAGDRYAAYFRCEFETETDFSDLILSLRRDDGVIVYLDGVEVARDNMPLDVEPAHDLLAAGNAGDTEMELRHLDLPGELTAGKHVLAISLHNRSVWSSDLHLADISLVGKNTTDAP